MHLTTYTDRRIHVDENGIAIRGIPLPKISRTICSWDEVHRIEEVPISFLRRMWLMGPTTSRTWWAFDPIRPLKGRALIIHIEDGIGPFDRIGVTVSNMDAVKSAIDIYAPGVVTQFD